MTATIATMSLEKIDVFNPMELSLAACVDLTVLGDDSELFYSGIDFHPDDRVVSMDNSNYKWVVMNRQLSVLSRNKKIPFD